MQGIRDVYYRYSQVQYKWQNFLPFVDRFGGGTMSEHSEAHLIFDARGVLTWWGWEGGQDKSGHGIDSGKKQ